MNLRHIDPRSTDWMDAMLEGELESTTQGRQKRQRGGEKAEGDIHPLVASQLEIPALLTTRSPPGHR